MLLKHPFERLQRHTRRCPRRGIARRDLASVGEAGLQGGARLALEHGDFMACPRQVIGACHANHAAAQDDDTHAMLRFACIPTQYCKSADW
ncbi:unnamed protein product [Mycetohabitans rhizoxinica HKI 454]|uniref:Uncharacterized protein n=1 Tax=Mycetohabitans rhizoxinica (strain DSM 19002 / CIP 109453 / HKI 454) TaxID=882378 RepID=E5ANR8_MYCRK|nr:unnamed protein product [Mycetohabitans rhizoxinica HKI 454]